MIRLTRYDGETVFLSADKITKIGPIKTYTEVFTGGDEAIGVKESPEEVARKVLEWQTAYRKNDIDTLYRLAGLKTLWEEKADKVIDGLIEKLGLEEQA